jgi:glycerophosphoryl diester phosphodiesterase
MAPSTRRGVPWRPRWSGVLLGVVVIVLVIAPLLTAAPVQRLAHFASHRPANIAHGGAQGHAPANTLEAYRMALEMGADTLELDAQLTADGQVVTHHNGTVDAQTDGSGAIADMTLAELRELDAGHGFEGAAGTFPYRGQGLRIATLDEVLTTFPDTFLIVELKTDGGPGIVEAVAGPHRAGSCRSRSITRGSAWSRPGSLRPPSVAGSTCRCGRSTRPTTCDGCLRWASTGSSPTTPTVSPR